MAIAVSLLTSAATYSGAQTLDTASFTLGANELGLFYVFNRRDAGSATPGTVTISQTGVTWVEITNILFDVIADGRSRLTLFRAMPTSSATAIATITVSGTGQAIWNYAVIKCTGTDTSGTNGSGAIVQSATNRSDAVSSLTVTLAALADATNNAVVVGFGGSGDRSSTPGTGYTELSDATANNDDCLNTQYKVPGTTTPSTTLSGTSDCAGIAVEVKMAAAAPAGQPYIKRTGGIPFMSRNRGVW